MQILAIFSDRYPKNEILWFSLFTSMQRLNKRTEPMPEELTLLIEIKPKQNSFGYKTKICLERKFIDNFCLLVLCKHQPKITSINCCYCIP